MQKGGRHRWHQTGSTKLWECPRQLLVRQELYKRDYQDQGPTGRVERQTKVINSHRLFSQAKFEKAGLHRRPEFNDSPKPEPGPSAPLVPPPEVKKPTAPIPKPPSHSAHDHHARPPPRSTPPPPPAPPQALIASPISAPQPEADASEALVSDSQEYFGEEDDSIYAEVAVGVEEGTMEEETSLHLIPSPKGAQELLLEPPISSSSEPNSASGTKPTSSSGTKTGKSMREMVAMALAENERDATGISKYEPKPTRAVAPAPRSHSVGGFHFPEGVSITGGLKRPVEGGKDVVMSKRVRR